MILRIILFSLTQALLISTAYSLPGPPNIKQTRQAFIAARRAANSGTGTAPASPSSTRGRIARSTDTPPHSKADVGAPSGKYRYRTPSPDRR